MSIILIHIGDLFPTYINDCIKQLRVFNEYMPIYVLLEKKHHDKITENTIILIDLNELNDDEYTKTYLEKNKRKHNSLMQFRSGFWIYTTLRFFYIRKFMEKNKLSNVFHFENDMMVYMDLTKNLSKFTENYEEFAITMHFDTSCVPAFMFIKDQTAINKLVEFMMHNKFNTDMDLLANFKEHSPKTKVLPIVYPDYIKNNELISLTKVKSTNPLNYIYNYDIFLSIFDAAYIGQYVGGIDPRNIESDKSTIGFINGDAPIQCDKFEGIKWITDENNRKIPTVLVKRENIKINNLHIHSKKLYLYSSL